MNKKQVIKRIGQRNWDAFLKYMSGQTVGYREGEVDYYEVDVERFIRYNRGEPVMFD